MKQLMTTLLIASISLLCFTLFPILIEKQVEADTTIVTDQFSQTDTLRSTEISPLSPEIIVGDADGNGSIDVDDAVFIIDYCLGGGPEPPRYRFVAQCYVRIWTATVIIDTTTGSLTEIVSPLETGEIFYVPCTTNSGGCR